MTEHENEIRPENEGEMPQREEGRDTFDERQRTPESDKAGERSDSPSEADEKP